MKPRNEEAKAPEKGLLSHREKKRRRKILYYTATCFNPHGIIIREQVSSNIA
jgi:hypothetical protein